MRSKTIIPFLFFLSVSAQAELIEVVPESYTFDQPTNVGSYEYHDWTGVQLIDGQYGGDKYSFDLGNGRAYEWLGWSRKPVVNIDFT